MSVWIARVAGFGAFAQEHSFVTGAKPYVNESGGVVSEREGEREKPSFRRENQQKNCVAAIRIRLTLRLHLDPVQGPAGCRLREVSPLPMAVAHLSFRRSPRSRTSPEVARK